MRIIVAPSAEDGAAIAAELIARWVEKKPAAVLGLATGSSPLPLYAMLASVNLDLSRVRGFALDEYIGLSAGDERSYAEAVRREVIEPLGMRPELVRVPNGTAAAPEAEAVDYERRIRAAGGIDIQILGIGSNGHLGFNEPPAPFTSRTRVVELAERTRADNARFFASGNDVPTHAITQGLGTISEARQLLLIAHGPHKSGAVAQALEGPQTEQFPASLLQRHSNALVVLDEAAAADLRRLRSRSVAHAF